MTSIDGAASLGRHFLAVGFDLDGVLLDAVHLHAISFCRALGEHGFDLDESEHMVMLNGLPTRHKLEILAKRYGATFELAKDSIARRKQELTLEQLKDVQPNPRHVELMEHLRSNGYLVGLASNSVRATVDLAMQNTGLWPFMTATLANEDVVRAKPAPDIYIALAARLGVQPRRMLVVEDTETGARAAYEAGCRVLKVNGVDEVCWEAVRERLGGGTMTV